MFLSFLIVCLLAVSHPPLIARYGGGPTLPRRVISSGPSRSEMAVEVYPLRLQLLLFPKAARSAIRISKKETIGELHKRACEIFDLIPDQVPISYASPHYI